METDVPSQDLEGKTCCSSPKDPPPDLSLAPSPNVGCRFYTTSSIQYEFRSLQDSEWTSVSLPEDHIPASGFLPSLLPYLFPSATPNLPCASNLALKESISHSPEKIQVGLCTLNTQKEEPSSLYFQLDKEGPSVLSSLVFDSRNSDVVTDRAGGKNSDLTEPDIPGQSRKYCNEDRKYLATGSCSREVVHVQKEKIYLHSKDMLQRKEKGERSTDTVQAQDVDAERSAGLSGPSASVYIDVCGQKETDSQLVSVLPPKTKQKQFRKVYQTGVNGTESESSRTNLMSHNQDPELHSSAEVKPNNLSELESLDLVMETSVDGSDNENEDMTDFFQQLDTEGHIYWAEPVQVSNPTLVSEELGSFKGSPENSLVPGGPADPNSFSSTGKSVHLSSSSHTDYEQSSSDTSSSLTVVPVLSLSTTDFNPSNHSVSAEGPLFLSSHIVHRKDVPYMTELKHNPVPGILPLDTSTPFRAVQSWTDLQIQRNLLSRKLLNGSFHSAANEVTQRPTVDFSPSPPFPRPSNDRQTHDSETAGNQETGLVSMDGELWPDKQEEMDVNGKEDEENMCKTDTVTRCCLCDQCSNQKSYSKQHNPVNASDNMMLSLKLFRSVLSMMEEELSEDQALVYSALSDKERFKVREIEQLRCAVKREAGELEMQLKEVAHQCDGSLHLKMRRLLDEQSRLSSELGGFLPEVVPT
ncbi:uncharacterized protein LOC125024423 [Mugil cephalus]|uniref:uncharacterized protein LOC125024423 n=1 Tax=Mugil cephalus TaxID=48193 RepID=UPI001FB68301|nr:uncharacterized protein LOC125024423 [Mugil cephalus]XP_047468130.1 uncharacterized protein LOC125024423 [Mugil cephalus]